MVPNPVPGGEEPTSALLEGMPPTIDLPAAEVAKARENCGNGSLSEASSAATHARARAGEPARLALGIGAGGPGLTSQPMVRLIATHRAEVSEAQADRPLDAFSPMPRPPVLDLGIEVARSVGSPEARMAAAETVADLATSEPEPSADPDGFESGPGALPAAGEPPMKAPQTASKAAPKGIEPLASALSAAVRLAADASVAAEALENLKRLLQHKQQLDGLRSAQAALARPSPGAEASAREAEASVCETPAALPVAPLPPLPLPDHAGEASVGSARLPLVPRRATLERRGLDVRGFLAGFALSWAFGVVLYFFMTAG